MGTHSDSIRKPKGPVALLQNNCLMLVLAALFSHGAVPNPAHHLLWQIAGKERQEPALQNAAVKPKTNRQQKQPRTILGTGMAVRAKLAWLSGQQSAKRFSA